MIKDYKAISFEYDFSALKKSTFFITGATGLLGGCIVRFLDYLNSELDYGIRILAPVRNEQKASAVFADLAHPENVVLLSGDMKNLPVINEKIDYVIHGASITASKAFVEKPVETIDIAVNGTMNVLELAKAQKVKSFVYLSSMEAFGVTPPGDMEVREEDLGYIDILNVRSSYSESKRMCELLCASYWSEYGVPARSVRLAQTLGPGIDYNDPKVTAQFARSVIEEKDIVLKTAGKTKRPVLYVGDAVSAVLTVLLKGENGSSYTAANPETYCTIRETAELIINRLADNRIKLLFEPDPKAGYAPDITLNLNIDKLKALGWKPTVGLVEAYSRLIESMKNERKN